METWKIDTDKLCFGLEKHEDFYNKISIKRYIWKEFYVKPSLLQDDVWCSLGRVSWVMLCGSVTSVTTVDWSLSWPWPPVCHNITVALHQPSSPHSWMFMAHVPSVGPLEPCLMPGIWCPAHHDHWTLAHNCWHTSIISSEYYERDVFYRGCRYLELDWWDAIQCQGVWSVSMLPSVTQCLCLWSQCDCGPAD